MATGTHVVTSTPPTPLISRFVKYVIGFGVSVAVGLAPYLGKVRVPFFTALLDLIPRPVQATAIPLSAALMGVVAVWIQFVGWQNFTSEWISKWFHRIFILIVITFVSLFVIHSLVVQPVQYGKVTANFLVGFSRPVHDPCGREVSDAECIKILSSDESRIASFWGDRQIRIAKIALVLCYLGFTSMFGFLVGLLLLKHTHDLKLHGSAVSPPAKSDRSKL